MNLPVRVVVGALLSVTACGGGGDSTGDDDVTPPDGQPDGHPPDGHPPDGHPIVGANLPLLSPPVRAAAPVALIPSAALVTDLLAAGSTLAQDFHDRFFSGGGPTDLFTILDAITSLEEFINTGSLGAPHACLSQTPIEYTITPFGQSVAFYAQCYQQLGTATPENPNFIQFGVMDGKTYLLSLAGGATRLAAIITPDATDPEQAAVDVWYGVGYRNVPGCSATFDGCSYATAQLRSDSTAGATAFEMAVAGINVGFCGAQIKSDGTSISMEGSADSGPPGTLHTCGPDQTTCVAADDLTAAGVCDTIAFELPAMGRLATSGADTWGASTYPATPNITLDGTGTDSLFFAPTEPTAGVGNWDEP